MNFKRETYSFESRRVSWHLHFFSPILIRYMAEIIREAQLANEATVGSALVLPPHSDYPVFHDQKPSFGDETSPNGAYMTTRIYVEVIDKILVLLNSTVVGPQPY